MIAAPVHSLDGATDWADTQRMLREALDAFVQQRTPLARVRRLRDTQPGYERALWREMAQLGWLGILVPEAYGGLGLGHAEMRTVAERFGEALIPEPLTACAVLARGALLGGSNEALKGKWLPAIANGTAILGVAWQEPTGVIDPLRIDTRAARGPGGVRLNGTKRFVTPAAGVDGYIVSARGGDELALFFVPPDTDRLKCTLERRSDYTYAGLLELSDVAVAESDCIARGRTAEEALTRALDEATIMACAELCGVMTRALAITLDYMKARVQFGRPIAGFQALQHRAVDLYIQKELASATVDDAVRALDVQTSAADRTAIASRCKSRCADAALTITREAIKLHGAIGFTDECDIGLYLQRALVLSAWLGNGAEHRRRYASVAETVRHDDLPSPDTPRARRPPVESPPDTDWNAMSDEHFRHEVRAFFEYHYPPHLRYLLRRARWAETREWILTMSRKGWLAPAWPRQYGGMGLSPPKRIIFLEERERWGVARFPDQGITMLGPVLMKYGTEEQKQRYLPPILAGEHMWCQGYSEPNAGSDLASLQTEAVPDGDEFVINGSKIWTSLAHDATHMFLLARTDKTAKRQEGISFFLLALTTPGVTIRPIRNIEGREEFCQVFFDDVRIPGANLVGEINKGWTVAKAVLGFERLNNGSPRRVQYPLMKLRALARHRGFWDNAEFRSRYTQLELDVADLASAYSRYADIVRRGEIAGPGISMLKIWAGETLQRLSSLLIETAGSAGCIKGELQFGDEPIDVMGPLYVVFPATIASGTNDIQRNIIAKRVLGLA